MNLPDYGKAVEQVGKWIAAGASLVMEKTMFLEPNLPPAPDGLATVFETGGVWDVDRQRMRFTLLLVTRAATQAGSRALAIAALKGAVSGWKTASSADRGDIVLVRMLTLPHLQPRGDDKRVILESTLELTVFAPFDMGVDE